jgi:hypothetical protein
MGEADIWGAIESVCFHRDVTARIADRFWKKQQV